MVGDFGFQESSGADDGDEEGDDEDDGDEEADEGEADEGDSSGQQLLNSHFSMTCEFSLFNDLRPKGLLGSDEHTAL